jgi:hypothetical protein
MHDLTLEHVEWTTPETETRRAGDRFFTDVFAAQTGLEMLWTPDLTNNGQDREESLMVIGDTMLVPMAPIGRGHEPESVVGQMCREFARPFRWMGMALHTSDIEVAAEWFEKQGLTRYYRPSETRYFLSDPEQTMNMRMEFLDFRLPNDPRLRPDFSADWWRDVHPLGIERLQSVGVATKDLAEARRFFTEIFPWEEISSRVIDQEAADAAAFLVGKVVVEAMAPRGPDTPLAEHAHRYGGVYCLSFKTRDPATAFRYLRDLGLDVKGDPDRRFWIDPTQAHGRRIVFSAETLAGDPRD